MKFISFFAGIGGLDLGLERAGHTCVGQCEINPFALRVLAKHWPGVPRFGDITELQANDLPDAELWCGGFPCQDISCAGLRAGIHGVRSGLFFDFMRLATEVRPRVLLLENVGSLINRGLSAVLGALAAGGYSAEWDCIPASAVGALHIRNRVFILAYARHTGFHQRRGGKETCGVGADGGMGRYDVSQGSRREGETVTDGDKPGLERYAGYVFSPREPGRVGTVTGGPTPAESLRRFADTVGREQWGVEPGVGRVVHGVPSRMDRIRCLGNAVVPQVAEYIGQRITQYTKGAK